MEVSYKLMVGQRMVYKGDMANAPGNGAIVALRPNASAGQMFSINFGSGKLEPFDSSVSYDIALDDGREFLGVYESNIGGELYNKSRRFMIADGGPVSAEELAALRAGVAIKAANDKAKLDARNAAFAKAKDEAKAAGLALGLIPEAEFQASGKRGSAAAFNLRTELKASGIKARVKQDGYSAISVWVAPANVGSAKAIGDKYEAGSFDGMSDCYEFDPSAWGSVFGDVRYVFVYSEG